MPASPWPPGHEKAPDTELNPIMCEGIRVRSRYGKAHELGLMRVMVFDLPPEDRAKLYSLSCDSKATYCFAAKLHEWKSQELAESIAHGLEGALLRCNGGHNGVIVEFRPRTNAIGSHYSLPAIWLEDRDSGVAYEILAALRGAFPAVFDPEAPVPLKIGIDADITAKLPQFKPPNLKIALSIHTRTESYLRAMMKGGARKGLTGRKSGEVTEAQAETARRMLGVKA